MATANGETKQITIRDEVDMMAPQFKAALPPHIPVERFIRIVMTAINGDPDLVAADRRSLFESAMKCAQDGLLPDKREAAFVVFNTNVAKKGEPAKYVKKVQYLPMVWGLVKKVRNSGELESITAHVVHENDEFSYSLGDSEAIAHTPLLKGNRGQPVLAYAIAKTKDGGIYREMMMRDEIDAVRNFSKAKDAWTGPFQLEMWRKTVIRRLSKRLPMSTDLERTIQRDDETYDLDEHRDAEQTLMPQRLSEKSLDEPTPTDEANGNPQDVRNAPELKLEAQ